MVDVRDTEYYQRREVAERDLADQSTDPQVKRIHLALADSYAAKTANRPVKSTLE